MLAGGEFDVEAAVDPTAAESADDATGVAVRIFGRGLGRGGALMPMIHTTKSTTAKTEAWIANDD